MYKLIYIAKPKIKSK